jgi:tetratricopeptide (TPR) repeat protein
MLPRVPRAAANYDVRSAAEAGAEQARRAVAWLVGRASVRWLAPATLVAVAVTAAALAISGLSGAGSANRASTRHAATQGPATGRASQARRGSPPRPGAPAPAQVSPTLAVQLESRGHALLQAGEPAGAVPVLRQALAATGESLEGCLEQASETCLTYAYALYDLGTALRLSRQPAAAVQILENRLRIANQRSTVQNELELARQEPGQQLASTATPG